MPEVTGTPSPGQARTCDPRDKKTSRSWGRREHVTRPTSGFASLRRADVGAPPCIIVVYVWCCSPRPVDEAVRPFSSIEPECFFESRVPRHRPCAAPIQGIHTGRQWTRASAWIPRSIVVPASRPWLAIAKPVPPQIDREFSCTLEASRRRRPVLNNAGP